MYYILGLSAYYHDSAAVLLCDGEIVAAVQEERFTRVRHDASFPDNAVRYCLKQADIGLSEIDYVVFYDKPFLKFERLLETHLATAPLGLPAFIKAMPIWLKEKLYLKKLLRDSLSKTGNGLLSDVPQLLFTTHHQSHAASAYYASPYEEAAVLCLDGVGEWATTSAWHGKGKQLEPLWQINFPHSIGLLYSAFTYYAGFLVNSGEYKLMGLAPYGKTKYVDLILDKLIDLKEDGSFKLDMSYFNFASGLTMTSQKFHQLFGAEPRKPESDITQHDMDIARSIQFVTEEVILRLAKTLAKETGIDNLCLAGGVALNCVANGRLLKQNLFKNIWVQPAAGDAGGALGAAYVVWHQYCDKPRLPTNMDKMQGTLLGTSYSDEQIETYLKATTANYTRYETEHLLSIVSNHLNNKQVVGWFQGRMEFGPRALGSRSILGDARSATMQSVINLKIKNRESFRPFAPAVLQEKVAQWFDMDVQSPYMLFVASLKKDKCFDTENKISGLEKLNQNRSSVPAITHIDYSARVQTVSPGNDNKFYSLLKKFEEQTQCPMLINTSFNVRGEPIVESPVDALRCFMSTDMDVLIMGSFVLLKKNQPKNLSDYLAHKASNDIPNEKLTVDDKTVRQFAVTTGVVVSLLFAWFIPWFNDKAINFNVFAFALPWILLGLSWPKILTPFYKGWMRFGNIMHRVMTPFILSVIYFALITPLGLLMRLFGKDALNRKRQASLVSYRIASQAIETENLEKPF